MTLRRRGLQGFWVKWASSSHLFLSESISHITRCPEMKKEWKVKQWFCEFHLQHQHTRQENRKVLFAAWRSEWTHEVNLQQSNYFLIWVTVDSSVNFWKISDQVNDSLWIKHHKTAGTQTNIQWWHVRDTHTHTHISIRFSGCHGVTAA